MTARTIRVDLPCGCDALLDIPAAVDVDVAILWCVDEDHDADRFLVTWRQVITATVVPLALPPVELGEGVRVIATNIDAAATVDHVDGERPVVNEPPGLAPGDVLSSPLTEEEWKAEAHRRNWSFALILKQAREIAEQRHLAPPKKLDEIDETLTPLVLEWLDRNHPAEERF